MDPRSQREIEVQTSANPQTAAEWIKAVNTPGSIIQQEITNALIEAIIEKKAIEHSEINRLVLARFDRMLLEVGVRQLESRVRDWLLEERRLTHAQTSAHNLAPLQPHQIVANRGLIEMQIYLQQLEHDQREIEKTIKSHETKIHKLDNKLKAHVSDWNAQVEQQAKTFTDNLHAGKIFIKNEHGQALPMTAERLNHMHEAYNNAPSPVRMFMKNPALINTLIALTANSSKEETEKLVKMMFSNMGGVLGQLQLLMAVRQLITNEENVSPKQLLALIKENRDLKMEPFNDKQMDAIAQTFVDLKAKVAHQNALQPLKDSLTQTNVEKQVAQEYIKMLQEKLHENKEQPDNDSTPKPRPH